MSVVDRLRSSRSADRFEIWRMTYPGLRPGWFVLGIVLLGSFLAIALTVANRTGASSRPVVAIAAAVAGAAAISALIAAVHRSIVPLSLAVGISWVAYRWSDDLAGGPLSGPFGYRNAFGGLLFLGALSWLLGGLALRHPVAVGVAIVPAGLLGYLAIRSSSATAAGVLLVLVAASIGWFGSRGARTAVIACGVATLAVLLITGWLGASYERGRPLPSVAASIVDVGITERRIALWHDALEIVSATPWGIGQGRFGQTSPTALEDRDTIYAHNEFLETAAELGVAAAIVMVLLVAWAFARLVVTRHADVVTAVSAAALAGASIHACVDYMWHFPAIAIATAALVGTGFVGRSDDG
jgi:O-antigen ligase